jgi:hypothetical protein
MTAQKHLKQRVRARMAKTGERYAAARRHVLLEAVSPTAPAGNPWHFPGNVPAAAALRGALAAAGVRAPHTGQPYSEAMLFGIAGGIGIGVFSFFYEKEDVATFFIGGRHQWYDDLAYLRGAVGRLGLEAEVRETGGARAAAQQLTQALAAGAPAIAWVDAALLPHRAMPASWAGGGYHVVTVLSVDEQAATAQIGDLADEPISISLDALAAARARIAKQRNRLLTVRPGSARADLAALVREGLVACHEGLTRPLMPGAGAGATLEALRTWAERLDGSRARERWERVFRPGPNLLRGLASIYDFVEHYGTGGGLCRPLFADFLTEAAAALGRRPLAALAERYAALGQGWSDLAAAALPDDVPLLRDMRQLHAQKAELLHDGAPAEAISTVWQQLEALAEESRERFPLSERDYAALRAGLRERITALYAAEVAASAALLEALPQS